MSDDEAAYRRAHREKQRRNGGGPLDTGAIAIGVLGALGGIVALLAVRPSPVVGSVLLAIGAASGGYLTGRTLEAGAVCRPCHAVIVVTLTSIVAALAGGAVVLAEPDQIRFVFVRWDARMLVGTFAVGLVLAVMSAWIGAARKP